MRINYRASSSIHTRRKSFRLPMTIMMSPLDLIKVVESSRMFGGAINDARRPRYLSGGEALLLHPAASNDQAMRPGKVRKSSRGIIDIIKGAALIVSP